MKEKHPIRKIRRKMPPPTKKMPNPKKEESKKACRNKPKYGEDILKNHRHTKEYVLTFYEWLQRQMGRTDRVGMFANDALFDSDFPGRCVPVLENSLLCCENYLNSIEVCPETLRSLLISFLEYSEYQEQAIKRTVNT